MTIMLGRTFVLFLLIYPTFHGFAWGKLHGHGSRHFHQPPSALQRRAYYDYMARNRSIALMSDYSCSASRPCSNGACCGASGYCGYGPTYCGDGCVSNCDASAECGEFSSPPNKKCPLNTCCSEFGFCGTTKDFCGDGCQSNCVLHPSPPSGSPKGRTLSKVIGYYEGWSARSNCHRTLPTDLPIDGMTHLNFAFAFIDPTSFEITTMDAATPVELFDDVAFLKVVKPQLQIYLSIGGWTFSDNDTVTQPIFGNIARSAKNRQIFANNLLKFLDKYGYDGVDIDWEYPGAGDRGGKSEDTSNFVLMLKTIRETFDKSSRKLGITFTVPSSYWYLRWFDLPGMLKYADWLNLMSYDLHGVWDQFNPIGNIVQGHTNLTEIKLATELLWRVKVPPSKVALGIGFYGRAFTLQDPKCKTPGCRFSGGARPGVCTGESGYLAYYEIQDILAGGQDGRAKRGNIQVHHDKDAAVKYFSWDENQWISYDDEETFKQKIDWADKVGFSGSLIWASDLDDFKLSAHKALTRKSDLGTALSVKETKRELPLMDELKATLGSKCTKFEDIVHLDNPQASDCRPDKKKGTDSWGQGEGYGKPICCPTDSGLGDCVWRGSASECNGQCHAGEVLADISSWGEHPGKRCSRGTKAFCCELNMFPQLTKGCYWTEKSVPCASSEQKIAERKRKPKGFGAYGIESYCCPKSQEPPFTDCHWVGSGDCTDNRCDYDEVTLDVHQFGDGTACNWGRRRALCCKPNFKALTTLSCDVDICETDPDLCDVDEWGEDDTGTLFKRSYTTGNGKTMWSYAYDRPSLEPRGGSRTALLKLSDLVATGIFPDLVLRSRAYRSSLALFKGDGSSTLGMKGAFLLASGACTTTKLKFQELVPFPAKLEAEHYYEFQMIKAFLTTAVTGILPNGKRMKAAVLDPWRLINNWHKPYTVSFPTIGVFVKDIRTWTPPVTPNDRIFEVLGSHAYRRAMTLVPKALNGAKSLIMGGSMVMKDDKVVKAVEAIGEGSLKAAQELAGKWQMTIAVFNYLNDSAMWRYAQIARQDLIQEILRAQNYAGLTGLLDIWEEFEPAFFEKAVATAMEFMLTSTGAVAKTFGSNVGNVNNEAVRTALYQAQAFWDIAQKRIKYDVK